MNYSNIIIYRGCSLNRKCVIFIVAITDHYTGHAGIRYIDDF